MYIDLKIKKLCNMEKAFFFLVYFFLSAQALCSGRVLSAQAEAKNSHPSNYPICHSFHQMSTE